jgi:hypothetical protein
MWGVMAVALCGLSGVIRKKMNGSPQEGEKHDRPNCPCCGGAFLCMANRAGHCPCTQVSLTRDEIQSLTWLWGESCLCPECLRQERDRLRAVAPD